MTGLAKRFFVFAFPIALSLSFSGLSKTEQIPTAEDVNQLARTSKLTTDIFMQETFEQRMMYECCGRFFSQADKEKLKRIANRASQHLQQIAKEQENLKNKIEGYEGNDWDQRYGQSGLWRKLASDIYHTKLNSYEADFYEAIAKQDKQTPEKLKEILSKIKLLNQNLRYGSLVLLKGRALAALSQTVPEYKESAIKELNLFRTCSDVYRPIKADLELIKLTGQIENGKLDTHFNTLKQNWDNRYVELLIELAFLQSYHNLNSFEKTIETFPQIKGPLGQLFLSELIHKISQDPTATDPLDDVSILKSELVTIVAWEKGPKQYQSLLKLFAEDKKFQRPLILYVAAVSMAETSPEKSVELLLKSSQLQQRIEDISLNIPAEEISKQAAKLAYNLFVTDTNTCDLTINAFENYAKFAGGQMDDKLEFLYAHLHYRCHDASKGQAILRKIATGNSKYSRKAALILAAEQVRNEEYKNPEKRQVLLQKFADSIEDNDDCLYAEEMLSLTKDTIENIELLQLNSENLPPILNKARKIIRFAYKCRKDRASTLILAELSTFLEDPDGIEHRLAEEIISQPVPESNDLDLLRCRARLYQKRGDFEKAAKLWNKITTIKKTGINNENRRNWQWWRAKFYELDCFSKIPGAKKEDVIHTIDVFESSLAGIPEPWAEKLRLLKQTCAGQSKDVMK